MTHLRFLFAVEIIVQLINLIYGEGFDVAELAEVSLRA